MHIHEKVKKLVPNQKRMSCRRLYDKFPYVLSRFVKVMSKARVDDMLKCTYVHTYVHVCTYIMSGEIIYIDGFSSCNWNSFMFAFLAFEI